MKRLGNGVARRAAPHPTAILIIIEPVGFRGRFSARLADGGRVIARSSRQPFLDAARVLVAEGHLPCTVLEARRPGATDWDLRAPLGVAAALVVRETAFGPALRGELMGRPPTSNSTPRIRPKWAQEAIVQVAS